MSVVDPNDRTTWPAPHRGAFCKCGKPQKQVYVKKEGPNHRREFYTCSEVMGAQCGTFTWGPKYRTTSPPANVPAPVAAAPVVDNSEVIAMLFTIQNDLRKVLQTQQDMCEELCDSPQSKRMRSNGD